LVIGVIIGVGPNICSSVKVSFITPGTEPLKVNFQVSTLTDKKNHRYLSVIMDVSDVFHPKTQLNDALIEF